jgi:hypothetical protein
VGPSRSPSSQWVHTDCLVSVGPSRLPRSQWVHPDCLGLSGSIQIAEFSVGPSRLPSSQWVHPDCRVLSGSYRLPSSWCTTFRDWSGRWTCICTVTLSLHAIMHHWSGRWTCICICTVTLSLHAIMGLVAGPSSHHLVLQFLSFLLLPCATEQAHSKSCLCLVPPLPMCLPACCRAGRSVPPDGVACEQKQADHQVRRKLLSNKQHGYQQAACEKGAAVVREGTERTCTEHRSCWG